MGFFPIDHPELKQFFKHLCSIDGGNRSESTAALIVKDISKYLYFCDSDKLDWNNFLDRVKLMNYFEFLKGVIQVEGILTKMERTSDVLNYLMVYSNHSEKQIKINAINEVMRKWKYTLRKEKKKLAHKRLEELSDSKGKLDLSSIKKFINDKDIWEKFNGCITSRKKLKPLEPDDCKFCMAACMVATLYESWQRPSAVDSCTLEQYKRGTFVNEIYVVGVLDHKTGLGGSAKLTINRNLKDKIDDYVQYIRPSTSEYLFCTNEGAKISKVQNIIRYLSNKCKIDLPSSTDTRKGGATAVALCGSESEVRLVSRQLAHDDRVHKRYYEAIRGKKEAVKAYEVLKGAMDEGEGKRPLFSTTEVETLKEKFKANIENLKVPLKRECENIFPNKKTQQVLDKIKTIIRQKKRQLKK